MVYVSGNRYELNCTDADLYIYSMAQALALVADLKLGLYCKIKPKAMFICQSYGTALGAIVNYSEFGRPLYRHLPSSRSLTKLTSD
jgi:hypothetical protein